MGKPPRVAIVGAGIVGATTAFLLAKLGAHVQLIERRSAPGLGVTQNSFGWVNSIHADPAKDPSMHALLREATGAFARLNEQLSLALYQRPTGSLLWEADSSATEAIFASHAAAGADVTLIDRNAVRMLEPLLESPPPCAIFSKGDVGIEAEQATRLLVKASVNHGAEVMLGVEADAILSTGGNVTGIATRNGNLKADYVVICSGADASLMRAEFGVDVALRPTPVAMFRYRAKTRIVSHIVESPDLEVRQSDDLTVLSPASCPDETDEQQLAKLAEETRQTIHSAFGVSDVLDVGAAAIGWRPMPANNRPIVKPSPALEGLYVAIAHPGIILAPLIAESITSAIHDERNDGRFW